MPWIDVTIVRFIAELQPGIVECEFEDANGHVHRVVDKCCMFSELPLWSDSAYTIPGIARCRVLELQEDWLGRDLALDSIAEPDGLETTDGETTFLVLAKLVSCGQPGQASTQGPKPDRVGRVDVRAKVRTLH